MDSVGPQDCCVNGLPNPRTPCGGKRAAATREAACARVETYVCKAHRQLKPVDQVISFLYTAQSNGDLSTKMLGHSAGFCLEIYELLRHAQRSAWFTCLFWMAAVLTCL